MRVVRVLTLWGACLAAAMPASAQSPPEPADDRGVGFLTRYAFHLTAEYLSGDDERFTWDANYGGELDVVDYGAGRFTFYANYQVITGDEFRAFDANQGNYILGGRLSGRLPHGVEVAGVFHHLSRHLSDRPKRQAVDWNMVGARVSRPFAVGPLAVEPRVDIRKVVQRTYVDYEWELDGGVRAEYPLTGHVALSAGGGLRRLTVDGSRNRDAQTGARGEGGVRFSGRAGAVELFLAVERRIDPYPLEFGTTRWMMAGFRLLGR